MRRLYTFFITASLSLASAIAQTATGFVGNGYYRVHNLASERYIYVTDNKDYYDELHDAEDFQAIQLWKDATKTISAPGSVIYIKQVSNGKFNLQAQGTGVYELTGYYVSVTKKGEGIYEVSASRGGVTKYLSDDRSNNNPQGQLGTSNKLNYRRWVVDKIETNHATNYFGITPSITLNGKYYQPFYAAFPFRTASPNMHVYYVSKIAGNIATLKEISDDIPASTPVIIECASTNPSENRLELLDASPAQQSSNLLTGVYFRNGERPEESEDAYTVFDASSMRLLTIANNKLIFSDNASDRLIETEAIDWRTEDYYYPMCIPANTCYLQASAGTPATLDIRFEGSGLDEILAENKDDSAEGVYTLSGSQLRTANDVKGLPAGVYVVGGVKVVIK